MKKETKRSLRELAYYSSLGLSVSLAIFIGLAMGLGTSLSFMFLGIAASKMEESDARQFTLKTLALSRMGHIGLTLLVISGGYLMTPYWSSLTSMPLMMAKLVGVVLLAVLIGVLSVWGKKAKQGDTEVYLKKMERVGKVSLLTTAGIVVLAVLIFH